MLKIDSRQVLKGDTFLAIKGIDFDGHDYIDEAISNGASKIIAMHGLYDVETIIVKDTNEYLKKYLLDNYYDKIKDIKIIGMTGTNGKTTTCYILHKCLNKLGVKSAYIGTIGFYIDDKIKDLNNTTPNIYDFYQMLLKCQEEGCKYVVVEVSSHALAYDRLDIVKFDMVIFSNLTKDHLDYHKTFENYALAKQKLFKQVKEDGLCFVNVDDSYKDYFMINENTITYGFNDSDYQIKEYEVSKEKTIFKVNDEEYVTKLLGKHNVYNLTSVIAVLKQMGFSSFKDIISNLDAPRGRMEAIKYNDNLIIIDYAHTPDAVLKVLTTVSEFNFDHIYTIIGCGGNRDSSKRYEMALYATNMSNMAIFTNDNPRFEDPNQIIEDMTSKLDNSNYEIILNRQKAIAKGIQKLQKNDILLILGKGHETYQVIEDRVIHFDDKEEVLNIIRR